jgi:hypothetical protein
MKTYDKTHENGRLHAISDKKVKIDLKKEFSKLDDEVLVLMTFAYYDGIMSGYGYDFHHHCPCYIEMFEQEIPDVVLHESEDDEDDDEEEEIYSWYRRFAVYHLKPEKQGYFEMLYHLEGIFNQGWIHFPVNARKTKQRTSLVSLTDENREQWRKISAMFTEQYEKTHGNAKLLLEEIVGWVDDNQLIYSLDGR